MLWLKGLFPVWALYYVQFDLEKSTHVSLLLRKVPGTLSWEYHFLHETSHALFPE